MSVSAKCKNQRLTKGKIAPIAVVKTTKKVGCSAFAPATCRCTEATHMPALRQGYGVIADATIKPRSLIIEYVGEVRGGKQRHMDTLNAQLPADREFMC